jgi:hypothetical protein
MYFIYTASTMSNDQEVVKWDDENSGYLKTKYSTILVYKPQYAIEMAIYGICRQIVNDPANINNLKDTQMSTRIIYDQLSRAYPKFTYSQYNKIENSIIAKVPKLFIDALNKHSIKDPKISDFVFLGTLGFQRNWKEGCAVCLTDKIMGTTCGCGHTEIAIFRPCGHSLCANPCFAEFMKTKNVELKPKRHTTKDGQVFITPGTMDIDLKTSFECPLCRTNITSTFRAEEVYMDKGFLNTEQLAEEIYYDMY